MTYDQQPRAWFFYVNLPNAIYDRDILYGSMMWLVGLLGHNIETDVGQAAWWGAFA